MTQQQSNDQQSNDQQSNDQQSNDQQSNDQQSNDQQSNDQQSNDQQSNDDDLQQSFGREYVEQLRNKSASYRLRAKEAEQRQEQLERGLFRERVARLDMVVEPNEVPYSAEYLEDESELIAAIESLLESKPYLRKRKTGGDIGQHDQRGAGGGFSLLGALKANAS